MIEKKQDRDARWRGPLALFIVGLSVALIATALPEDGATIMGQRFSVQLPEGFPIPAGVEKPRDPAWSPEAVEALLARYDEEWEEATEGAADKGESPSETRHGDTSMTVHSAARTMDEHPVKASARLSRGTDEPDTVSTLLHPPPPHEVRRTIEVISDDGALPDLLKFSVPEDARPAFGRLFASLDEHGQVAILHYGDSQIEGDRISGVLRNVWQNRWGGYGPGLQAPVPLVQSFAVRQSHTGPWKRHTRYGRRDTTDLDERYGMLACYAEIPDAPPGFHCLSIEPEPRNHKQFGRWDGIRLWHDTVRQDCPVYADGQPFDTLRAGTPPGLLMVPSPAPDPATRSFTPSELCFDGIPPRIFGVEPMGRGVQWHGVPMRGSSGTLFRKLERAHFSAQLKALSPDLILLQYGGNMVPYCEEVADAERYSGWFSSQIRLFHRILPQAAILVIGPSDMSEKQGVDWTTYPLLPAIRDALKQAAMDNGAAYWDLFEVMGGTGSMPAWVASEPPLAGPDHVHFTPLGAKKVGTLLDRAFLSAYSTWKRNWSTPAPDSLRQQSVSPLSTSNNVRPELQQHVPD